MGPPSQTTTNRPANSLNIASQKTAPDQLSKEPLAKVRESRPSRSRRGDNPRAAATETFSRVAPFCARSGVWPCVAQVRRARGALSRPVSSIQALGAPCRRAFF
jgi:hypothetical protein